MPSDTRPHRPARWLAAAWLMGSTCSANGTAARQAWVADLGDAGVFGQRGTPGFARSADWRTEADRILAAVEADRRRGQVEPPAPAA